MPGYSGLQIPKPLPYGFLSDHGANFCVVRAVGVAGRHSTAFTVRLLHTVVGLATHKDRSCGPLVSLAGFDEGEFVSNVVAQIIAGGNVVVPFSKSRCGAPRGGYADVIWWTLSKFPSWCPEGGLRLVSLKLSKAWRKSLQCFVRDIGVCRPILGCSRKRLLRGALRLRSELYFCGHA